MKFHNLQNAFAGEHHRVSSRILFCLILFIAPIPATAAEENKAILKVIHSEKVRTIMLRLNSLMYEREYTQLELQQLRYKQIQKLVVEAKKLTATAASIPDDYSLKELTDEQQLAFNAMANQLYETSLELQSESKAGHRQAVDDAYNKLQETCHTCHSLFRNW